MRRYFALFMLLVFFLISGCDSTGKQAGKQSDSETPLVAAKLEGLAQQFPANSAFILHVRSLEKLFQALQITEESILGTKLPDMAQVQATLGFNPLKRADLERTGINMNGEFALVIPSFKILPDQETPKLSLLLCLPVSDSTKTIAAIKRSLQKNAPQMKVEEQGALVYVTGNKPSQVAVLAKREGYLIAALGNGYSKAELEAGLAQGKSGQATDYGLLRANLGGSGDLVFYMDVAAFLKDNQAALQQGARDMPGVSGGTDISAALALLQEYSGLALDVNLTSSDLDVRAASLMRGSGKLAKVYQAATRDRSPLLAVKNKPLLLASFALDWGQYIDLFMKEAGDKERKQFDSIMQSLTQQIGIDFEKDLVNNLAGSINLAIYSGGDNPLQNALITMAVKDEGKARKLLASLGDTSLKGKLTKTSVEGKDTWQMALGFLSLYGGVHRKHLILASGSRVFKAAADGNPGSGFVGKLQDEQARSTLRGNSDIFYVDLETALKSLNSLIQLMGQGAKNRGPDKDTLARLKQFRYLLVSSTQQKSGDKVLARAGLLVKTRFQEPFVPALVKMVGDSQ